MQITQRIRRIFHQRAQRALRRAAAQAFAGLKVFRFGVPGGLMSLLFAAGIAQAATFNITSATFGTGATNSIPAGINGVTLELGGTLPSVAQAAAAGYQACFYTGYGSTAALPLAAPNGTNAEPLVVPASTIQAIPVSNFTAANGYTAVAYVYFVGPDATCTGSFDATLTNEFPVMVVAPSLGTYAGPTTVPQTNSATSLQAAPLTLTLPASGILPIGSTLGTTTVVFGSIGSVTPVAISAKLSTLTIAIPAAFASSKAGTAAALQVCNTFGNSTPVCTTPTPAITLTVAALVASAGTVTATPNPLVVTGQAVLTAQFAKAAGAGGSANPGAPSGMVTFTAPGATVAPAPLILDPTATFATQTTSVSPPLAPTPTITPKAGSYLGAQTITIADTNPAATIYYTQDGSVPTNGSTLYTGPFSIMTSQTVNAIAAVPGSLNSAVASAAYVVTIRPATHLGFQVQPVTTALNTAITPALQVTLLDSTGAVVVNATNAVTMAIQANPGQSQLGGTTTVNAVNGVATFSNLTFNNLGTGYTLAASSGTLTGIVSNAFNIIPPAITLTVPSELVGINSTLNGSFTLGAPAGANGVTVNLSSSAPANVTIAPATVNVAAGGTTGAFTYTGVAAGNSTLSAAATGYQTGTAATTGTSAQVSLGMIPAVAPGQTQSIALSLATAAPAGGTTVTFTIANTNIATVTQSVFVPAGMFTAATNPQVAGVLIGTTTVTANAPGYAPATRAVTVTVTASFNPATTNINLITSTNTVLQISAPAPAGGIKFNLTSSDPTKATVPASVTVIQGGTNVKVPITGVADGTVTIAATSAGITEADGTVVVDSTITSPNFTTGYGLQYYQYYNLPVTPSVPTNVTIKISDPTVALISTSQTVVGQQTVLFSNVTTGSIGYLYIQGKKVGTTTLTISAPGYTTGTETITVSQSGFAYYYGNQNFTTTTYATATTLTVYPFLLDPTSGGITGYPSYAINPGTPNLSLPITSSDTTIGTVTSPIVFKPLDTSESFTFTPVAAGTANLTIGAQPTGFTEPMQNGAPQYQTAVATVNTPVIIAPSATVGVHTQAAVGISLPVTPPSGITVTVTITSSPVGTPLAANASKSSTVVGTSTLTFTNVTSASVGTIYIQGQSLGSATITVSAPGYTTGTNTITVQNTGFAYYYGNQNFSTTSFSSATSEAVYPFLLDGNNAPSGYPVTLSPGVGPVTVPLTNSTNSVGTISANSLVFNTGDSQQLFTFQPVSAGTDTITIGAVSGFTTPSNNQTATVTVTAPSITVGGTTTGVHLQQSIGIYLPVAPPSGRTVTVTSSAPGVVTLAKDNVTAGTATVTFTNVTTSYVGTVYVLGQGVGTSTITESAPGYVTGTNTLTVLNSGFGFYPSTGTFSTTTFSTPNTLTVYTLLLDSNNNFAGYGLPFNPGVAPVTVAVTDSNASVGTISSSSLVFGATDSYKQFTFQPVSAGTANLTLSTPSGFTATTATSSAGVATVTAPAISVGNTLTGINLESALGIYLPQTPPNPVTVTVKSNGPLIAVLANGATVTGTGTLTFNNVTSTNVGTIYVQGLSEGSTTMKVSAPGYTDGDATITVDPSGFSFYYGNSASFTTSVGSNPSQLSILPVALVHGTLTPDTYNNLYVSPSAGTVSIPVTSSSTGVGTVASPVTLAPGVTYGTLLFTPVASGTTTINIGTPAGFSVPTDYTTSVATVQ